MTLTLNVVMMVVAFYVAQLLGTGLPQKKSIAIEGLRVLRPIGYPDFPGDDVFLTILD